MTTLYGFQEPGPSVLDIMRSAGGQWAAYRNEAMDSSNLGHLQFLKYGEGCTHQTPPDRYPADTRHGLGWRYLYVGTVNLETGTIEPKEGKSP